MPGIVALVTAISNDVVAKLAAANYPALPDLAIIMGKGRKAENSFAPRIIFIPHSSSWGPPSTSQGGSPTSLRSLNAAAVTGGSVRSASMTQLGGNYSATPTVTLSAPDAPAGGVQATAMAIVKNGAINKVIITNSGSGYIATPTITITDATGSQASAVANMSQSPQALAISQQRSILTEWVMFEVHCWGMSGTATGGYTPDNENDFDATQALYQQVIASTHLLAAGQYRVSGGKWADSEPGATIVDNAGHGFIFFLELATPLLDYAVNTPALSAAPTGVQPNGALSFISPTGTVEAGPTV